MRVGDQISGGSTILGRMGNTGGDYAPHLHVEVWTNSSRDNRIDPLPLIGQGNAPLATTNLGQEQDEMKAFFVKKQNDPVIWLVQGSIFRRRMINDRDWTDTAFLLDLPKSYREVQALDSCGLDVATFV